ncbi:MAG: ribonuclease catalytic domain-containing protein [Desulfovibrio sp.]|nr:ribonuclease catalytic domain-containing protein [Desulfovibrio sp.]
MQHPGPGCVVEFLHSNKPQLAIVVGESGGRLRLFTQNKRETLLPAARVLPWAGPQYSASLSRNELEAILEERHQARAALEAAIDPMAIWELAQGELEQADLTWFAELLWPRDEARDADRRAAVGRVLLACKTHFRFQPPAFEIHPQAMVEARLVEQEQRAAREALQTAGERLFPLLWSVHLGKAAPPPPPATSEERQLAALLRTRISNPDDQETAPLWQQLRKGLPPEEPQLPFLLARAWGLVPFHYNIHLDQADYDPDAAWGVAYQEQLEAWAAAARSWLGQDACPVLDLPLTSIDGETTRDIDDAFHILALEDGGFHCTVALACPALGYPLASPLDAAVRQRASSLYLPEAVLHMLPESVGIAEFSLFAGQLRPVLVLDMRLDAQGMLVETSPRLARATVAANLTYQQAEAHMLGQGDDPCGLRTGHRLALLRRQRRLDRGALQVERSEPEVVLECPHPAQCLGQCLDRDVRVRLEHKPATPMAQLLVSELMILVNAATARWAESRGVPLLHRTQDVPISAEAQGIWSRPQDIYRAMRGIGATGLELAPRRHATLGEPMYAPVSSPLRRYVDLVNQIQLVGAVQAGQPPLGKEQLEAMLPSIQSNAEATGRVQRFRTRYWKMEALRQAASHGSFRAVVVEEHAALVTCAIPDVQLYIRGPRRLFGDDCHVGQRVQLTLGRIDPLHNEMHIVETAVDYGVEDVLDM